jgi:hypothetical protein
VLVSIAPQPAVATPEVASASDILGGPVEPGSEVAVAQRFLARHGLRPDDELAVAHGPWEPEVAGVVVTRGDRSVASVELKRETDGWMIRQFYLCDDFGN